MITITITGAPGPQRSALAQAISNSLSAQRFGVKVIYTDPMGGRTPCALNKLLLELRNSGKPLVIEEKP